MDYFANIEVSVHPCCLHVPNELKIIIGSPRGQVIKSAQLLRALYLLPHSIVL